jgi:hypothetical protein
MYICTQCFLEVNRPPEQSWRRKEEGAIEIDLR